MIHDKLQNFGASIKRNWKSACLNFLFIILFINVFQTVFGAENSIVGVIFAIMMSASMVRDMTARPFKHLFIQALVMVGMGGSAFLVQTLDPWLALPVNFLTLLVILYAFTYEYASHMYFPYILSYLFLVFISPVTAQQLPRRLGGLAVGAVCIILYQLFMGRRRVVETAQSVLTTIIVEAQRTIRFLLTGEGALADPEEVRKNLCRLSRTVYERRKKVLCVSDASFSMIDSGRGLEHLILLMLEWEGPLSEAHGALLREVSVQLDQCAAYVRQERADLPEPDRADFSSPENDPVSAEFYHVLSYIRSHLLHMKDPEKQSHYRKTALSLSVRLKAALDLSAVRVVYALRVSVLLAVFTLLCQLLDLPHGKWLLFTLASLSMPYADDISPKTKKRIIATATGGLVSVLYYGLVPSSGGRTFLMMFSGFISYFFSDYAQTYACSTIGALGGAVFMTDFGLPGVGNMFLIRLGYILLGAVLAWFFNCLLFPFKRDAATQLLLDKYAATTELLSQVCLEEEPDPQLYYNLVIQAHLQEDKLASNASAGAYGTVGEILSACRSKVRHAHRQRSSQSGATPAINW